MHRVSTAIQFYMNNLNLSKSNSLGGVLIYWVCWRCDYADWKTWTNFSFRQRRNELEQCQKKQIFLISIILCSMNFFHELKFWTLLPNFIPFILWIFNQYFSHFFHLFAVFMAVTAAADNIAVAIYELDFWKYCIFYEFIGQNYNIIWRVRVRSRYRTSS